MKIRQKIFTKEKKYVTINQPKNYGGIVMTWFNQQNRLVQLILLLIPGVNWITEIVVRWSTFAKKGGLIRLIICIVVTFAGAFIGWLDLIWVLLFKKLFLQ